MKSVLAVTQQTVQGVDEIGRRWWFQDFRNHRSKGDRVMVVGVRMVPMFWDKENACIPP